MPVPFDTLCCAKRLESAGFTREQAPALADGLAEAATARSYLEDAGTGSNLGARRTAILRKRILTFDDWLFIGAFVLLSVAVFLPD